MSQIMVDLPEPRLPSPQWSEPKRSEGERNGGDGNLAAASTPVPDPEVSARPTRRRFSAQYEAQVVEEVSRCTQPGQIGALLRREGLVSSQLTREIQAEVEAQHRTAEQRTRFEQAIFRIQSYVTDQKIKVPECFISYAWGVKEHERWVEKSLASVAEGASSVGVALDGLPLATFLGRAIRYSYPVRLYG